MKTTKNINNLTKLNKKLLITVVTIFSSFSSQAASTGTINISGYIAPVTEITVNTESSATNLNLNNSANNLVVGTVVEKSNVKSGYKVTVSSANNGVFKGQASGNNDAISYSLKYQGNTINLANSNTNPVVVTNSSSRTSQDGVSKTVSVSYTSPGFVTADSYSDVLTFTISSNN